MTLIWTPGWNGLTEPEAVSYVAAVEAADGQPLEFATAKAINDFVLGCKNDGIWTAIKASCILSGARTLAGALVPLAGTAPTNFNFVSGDYNRKTGLVGNGTTKYLNSNRNNNADPQNSKHLSVYISQHHTRNDTRVDIGTSSAQSILQATSTQRAYRANCTTSVTVADSSTASGLWAVNRSSSASLETRFASSTNSSSNTSTAPASSAITVYSLGGIDQYSNARLAFYSIGESLDLALLDGRVTALINAFAAAIP